MDDLAATEARLLELGGTAIPSARARLVGKTGRGGEFAIATLADPDGIRIELVQRIDAAG